MVSYYMTQLASMKPRRFVYPLLLLLCLVASGCASTMLGRFLILRKSEGPIELYGKLIDQFGEPVKNATIRFETEKYGIMSPHYKQGIAKSDENGCFEIRRGRAALLYIEAIVRRGYEFRRADDGNQPSFDFRRSRRERYRPNKENPVLFHLRRKQAEGTFLIDHKEVTLFLRRETEEQWWGWDVEKQLAARERRINVNTPYEERKDTSDALFENERYFWDIWATWNCDLEKRQWHVTFRTNGENSGIQIREDFLYEAPEEGYFKSLDVVFPFVERESFHFPVRYFYIRLREPGMYSRFEIAPYSFADEKQLFLVCKGVINPYGDRSLEPLKGLTKIPWIKKASNNNPNLAQKIRKSSELFVNSLHEAEKAFREQRLAPRPPFQEWIKEGLAIY